MTATFTGQTLAFFHIPGGPEWIVILVIALLLFGKRLPEVGKSLGKGIVEFKKGLKGVKDELDEVEREVDEASNEVEEPKKLDADVTEKGDESVVPEKSADKAEA